MTHKPTVMVTGPNRGGGVAWWCTAFQVWVSGGKPKRVTPDTYKRDQSFDSLIVGGGADVNPKYYDQSFKDEADTGKKGDVGDVIYGYLLLLLRILFGLKSSRGKLDQSRDEMEMELIKAAHKAKKPILGICRGCQLINVYFGGTLTRELSNFYQESPNVRTVFPAKAVKITPGTRLHELFSSADLRVNALHDQAVETVAECLQVSAQEPNGVVQGIEHKSLDIPVIGVQWHPEFMIQIRAQRRLFRWLLETAKMSNTTTRAVDC